MTTSPWSGRRVEVTAGDLQQLARALQRIATAAAVIPAPENASAVATVAKQIRGAAGRMRMRSIDGIVEQTGLPANFVSEIVVGQAGSPGSADRYIDRIEMLLNRLSAELSLRSASAE